MDETPKTREPSEIAPTVRKPTRSARRAIVGGIAIAVVGIAALLLWQFIPHGGGGGGRIVSAPPSLTLEQPSDQASLSAEESKLTIAPEQLQRAGIQFETVGERVSTDATGQQTTGIVQPNSYRETPAMSLVGGIVRSFLPELGQNVRKGQTIGVISSNEFAETQAKYLAAVAELDEHHKHHARTEKLVEIGAASREELEMATGRLKAAESDVANLRQRLLLLGFSSQRVNGLGSTSQISSEMALTSPASGTVTSRTVNPGEVIEANKELLRVTDLSSVWIVAQVYEKDLGKIHVGVGASVTTEAYAGRIFRGQVSYVDPNVDPQTRTAQARIELANPDRQLKLGMYVNVAFSALTGGGLTVPVIPVAAVQNLGNQQIVFVATNDPNVFTLRPVRLGPESNGVYPVLEGVTVGERVVTQGSFLLRAEWLKSHPTWQR